MQGILMITAIAGAENCAAMLSKQFQMPVEVAASRREGIAALRRHDFLLAIIDESQIEHDHHGAEELLRHTGPATPLEINFALSGYGRVERSVRAALERRQREGEIAARSAAAAIRSDIRKGLAGLLLHAELAHAEPGISPSLAAKLKTVVALAGSLRQSIDETSFVSQTQDRTPPLRARTAGADFSRADIPHRSIANPAASRQTPLAKHPVSVSLENRAADAGPVLLGS
jgi:signal transduction histidine kinase